MRISHNLIVDHYRKNKKIQIATNRRKTFIHSTDLKLLHTHVRCLMYDHTTRMRQTFK